MALGGHYDLDALLHSLLDLDLLAQVFDVLVLVLQDLLQLVDVLLAVLQLDVQVGDLPVVESKLG